MRPEVFCNIYRKVKASVEGKKIKDMMSTYIYPNFRMSHKSFFENAYTLHLNKHFTLEQYVLHILLSAMFNPEVLNNPYKIDLDKACKVKEYTEQEMKKDQDFIVEIANRTNIKDIRKIFDINSDGGSIALNFMKKGYVSPYFLVKYSEYMVSKFNENEEHSLVRRIVNVIKQVKQGK